MNFTSVKSITIPEGSVYRILSGSTVLWTKAGSPGPSITLPPSNEIWYEATSQISSNIGSPSSHTYDSTTGRGVLTYENDIQGSTEISPNAFKSNETLTKIWWPDVCTEWVGDCMHSCASLKEIYAGSGLNSIDNGVCGGGTTPDLIYLKDNNYFYENNTGLVLKSNNTLLLGTYNLDISNIPCVYLGSRFMADMKVGGATLKFPSSVTGFQGDWNVGISNASYTMYFYSTVAPTTSHYANIRCSAAEVHIPVGSLSSYQTTWSGLSNYSNITFVEDL